MQRQPSPTVSEVLRQAGVGPVFEVGTESAALITQLRPTREYPNAVGNVRRGSCELGMGIMACDTLCQFDAVRDAAYCADQNVAKALRLAGVSPERTILIAATKNTIGFADQPAMQRNELGWLQADDYNAFFVRPERDGIAAIGAKMADCACLFFEFKDGAGNTVIGFEHSTKINMRGSSAYDAAHNSSPFTDTARTPVSYTHSVLSRAIEHYAADPAGFHIRLVSGIKPENYTYTFKSKEYMEKTFPGLYAGGFLQNANPDWSEAKEINSTDIWRIDARGLILHDIRAAMRALGMPAANFTAEHAIDPADPGSPHSSHSRAQERGGDFRDLYLLVHKSALSGVQYCIDAGFKA